MDRFIFNLTKLLFYILSILTIILAITVFVLSILTIQRITINNHEKYAPEKSIIIHDFYFLISICISGSILIIFISLYGINAVYFESKIFLIIHGLLLLLIHSSSLLIASAIFFDEKQIGAPASLFFKAHYDYALLTYSYQPIHNKSLSYNDLYYYGNFSSIINITFDSILDRVHKRLHCCGLMGTSDFAKLHIPIPPSCFNDNGIAYESSCLYKFRLESVYKAQIFAICIYIMGILTLVSFIIDLILLREFLQDQLLEHVIERLINFSNIIEPMNETKSQQQYQSLKPQVQQYIIDYLLENTM
ncbi:unnamed protein product [Rotaria sordida]|uniref:Tetraspanin n=1 Tax=Rotaria sordida TaxID=392033 RepID=A0A814BBW8_9BILA|nr:unnamed protein product [Rotaria sordida]CAF1007949.1 unnamed protein product [Rotaria sordida]